jgi:hypothetical protein
MALLMVEQLEIEMAGQLVLIQAVVKVDWSVI